MSRKVNDVETKVARLEEQVITLFKSNESVLQKLDKMEVKFDKELRVAMLERAFWLALVAVVSNLPL
jgi:hypothetical protein